MINFLITQRFKIKGKIQKWANCLHYNNVWSICGLFHRKSIKTIIKIHKIFKKKKIVNMQLNNQNKI